MDGSTAGIALLIIGIIAVLVGAIWLDIERREEKAGHWGFFLFGWVYSIYYGITRWNETKVPTTICLGGVVLFIIGILTL